MRATGAVLAQRPLFCLVKPSYGCKGFAAVPHDGHSGYAAEMLLADRPPAYRVASDPGIRILVSDLACCALEVGSAVTQGLLNLESENSGQARITVVLISGTVTELLAPVVVAQWAAVPEPKISVAVGACASSGGPYWDAPTAINGISELIPAGGFIAGCPPRPDVIVDGVLALVGAP